MYRATARITALLLAAALLLLPRPTVALAASPADFVIASARPGQTLRYNLTINHDNSIWYTANFSCPQPTIGLSVENVSANASIQAELRNVVQVDGKTSGVVALRFSRADGAPYTAADYQQKYTAELVMHLADGSTAAFPIEATLGDAPHFADWVAVDEQGSVHPLGQLQVGQTYTLRAQVVDLNQVSQTHTLGAKWSIPEGKELIYLEDPVIVDGVATAKLDTLARGSASIAIHTYVDGRLSTTYRYTVQMEGSNLSMTPEEVQKGLQLSGSEAVLTVPSNRNLDGAALNALQMSALSLGAERVTLRTTNGVSLSFSAQGLSNADFLRALNGQSFDPTVSLGLPAAARSLQYNEYNLRWLDFAHNGALPGATTVSVQLPRSAFIGGNPKLELWRLNPETGELEAQPDSAVQVQADPNRSGYLLCSFTLTHASVWALVPAGYTPTRSANSLASVNSAPPADSYVNPTTGYPAWNAAAGGLLLAGMAGVWWHRKQRRGRRRFNRLKW